MRIFFQTVSIIAVVVLLTVAGAVAGKAPAEKAPNTGEKGGKVSPQAQAVSDYGLAAQLAAYGQKNDNPVALLAAAQIMKSIEVQEKKREKQVAGTSVADAGEKKGAKLTPESLLADAKKLVEGKDANMVALIDKESKQMGSRGRDKGPSETQERVLAEDTDIYHTTFKGKEVAKVLVISDGDCDIDLFVYDENGNLVAKDDDDTPHCLAEWTPKWTGSFTIKVKNWGSVYSDYVLMTN